MGYESYSHEEYQYAMELLDNGCGLTETCRRLGWPETKKSLLHYWKHRKHKPPTTRWHPKPSSKLAYVLGVLNGDGCIVREHHYNYDIELLVKDYAFAETFSKAMAILLNKKYMEPYWSKSHKKWRIYYRSKAFYQWYKNQTLQMLKQHIEYNKDTVASFLRGAI